MQFSKIIDKLPVFGRKSDPLEEFWNLVQQQVGFLYNVAFKFTGNRYDAEDLVQDTLYKACRNFHQLRDRHKFKSWIFSILRHHFLARQRQKNPARAMESENGLDFVSQLEDFSLENNAASIYERKVESDAVQSILNKLPEKYKSVLILYYMEENSYQEIADMLQVPIGTVMSRLSRAKQHMKKALLRSRINALEAKKVIRLNN